MTHVSHDSIVMFPAKLRIDTGLQSATENDFDASPKEATIRQLGMILKSKSAGVVTENDKSRERKEKKKSREDEKLEKRRLKEEERQRRLTEKKKKKQNKSSGSQSGPGLEEFIQSPSKLTPLFVEKCIEFIEEEGLDSEGIYRVPGNRAHVDLLFQKFDEGENLRAFVYSTRDACHESGRLEGLCTLFSHDQPLLRLANNPVLD